MGCICQLCGCERPHEQFGGRGYNARVCKRCRRLPKSEQRRILATDEIIGFLEQSNISEKNIRRLEALGSLDDPEFQEDRGLILEIARAAPRRRRRWSNLRRLDPDLMERLDEKEWFHGVFDAEQDELAFCRPFEEPAECPEQDQPIDPMTDDWIVPF